jgi:hypothetical protein
MLTQNTTQPAQLTYFSHALREQCVAKGTSAARMRNGDWCTVEFIDGGFRSKDRKQHWRVDGNSTASSEFDLVEFSPAREVLATWTPLAVDVQAHRAAQARPGFMH